jgi:prepilin-type N-terminal cleavage/methylation domain-containing protein
MQKLRRTRGFTLIEMLVATAIGAVGVAAAFAFARNQMQGYAQQNEVSHMQSSAQLVLESLARDIRNAGFGTSFYAGAEPSFLNGQMAVLDQNGVTSRGFPAVAIADNVNGVAPPAQGPSQGSDAVTFLRVISNSATVLDPIGCTTTIGTPINVDPGTIANLSVCQAAANPTGDFQNFGMLLVSDSARPTGEPEGMIVPVRVPPTLPNTFLIRYAAGVNLSNANVNARCPNLAPALPPNTDPVPPNGTGNGSTAVCVQPVTYWLDNQSRLRQWRFRGTVQAANAGGGDSIGTGTLCNNGACGGGWPQLPMNATGATGTVDTVLAEGVEDFQISFQVSTLLANSLGIPPATWINSTPGVPSPLTPDMMSEVRVIRISAIIRTARAFSDSAGGETRAYGAAGTPSLENHNLPTAQVINCDDPSACYDPRFIRRRITFEAELRNMRIFDVLSTNARTYTDMRSYR